MEKVAIFIDGGYLAKILEPVTGNPQFALDFGKLSEKLANGDNRLRTYYYNCPPYVSTSPTPDEQRRTSRAHSFYDALNRLPRFQVRLGNLAFRGNKADGSPVYVQKRVDALLCVDMVQLALTHQISKAILLAGDSDFMPAVEVVKQNGVLVELWHGPKSTVHNELWMAADERQEIDRVFFASVQRPAPQTAP